MSYNDSLHMLYVPIHTATEAYDSLVCVYAILSVASIPGCSPKLSAETSTTLLIANN